ncbi:MAG: DoxX family protein [Ilumatobacteraceae bacterium]
MSLAVAVIAVTVVANLAIATADLFRAKFVLANSAEVGVPESWLPGLAVVKGAGAVGLVVGLAGASAVGIAAAGGLVLFYIGAVAAHLRCRVLYNIAFPMSFLGLAIASLVLMISR